MQKGGCSVQACDIARARRAFYAPVVRLSSTLIDGTDLRSLNQEIRLASLNTESPSSYTIIFDAAGRPLHGTCAVGQ
jgi:hypothetical protein